jgi:hypothetical protein
MAGDKALQRVCAEMSATGGGEDGGVRVCVSFLEPLLKGGGSFYGQRRTASLSAFPETTEMRPCAELDILISQSSDLSVS